jgi:hypothetical protein
MDSEFDHIVTVYAIGTNHGITDATYYDDMSSYWYVLEGPYSLPIPTKNFNNIAYGMKNYPPKWYKTKRTFKAKDTTHVIQPIVIPIS